MLRCCTSTGWCVVALRRRTVLVCEDAWQTCQLAPCFRTDGVLTNGRGVAQGEPRTSVLPMIQQVLPQLLDELFKLMDEIGNDELVATLEVLIESFAEHMAPYAQGLCQRLAEHFVRLALTESGQEGEEEASFAATQCCSAITTLLESIKKTPELYPHLEQFLVPMLRQILTPDAKNDYQCMEFMEDGLEILTYLTYYAPTISDLVWQLFRPLLKSFHDWAFDYLHNINLPLDNFISRSNDKFLGDPEHIKLVFEVIQKAMSHEDSSDRDCVEGCKLTESLGEAQPLSTHTLSPEPRG